jgi:putative zinc finger/helix-turn-helix YgiT family protein
MTEPEMKSLKPATQGKPFPWRCTECGGKEVYPATVPYTSRIRLDGIIYSVELPELRVPKCRTCGELIFDNDADEQIHGALRKQLRLLLPEQIRENRAELGLSHRQLAAQLRVDAETISLWEDGLLIQSPAMDALLRLYFGVPEVRAALVGADFLPSLGTHLQS